VILEYTRVQKHINLHMVSHDSSNHYVSVEQMYKYMGSINIVEIAPDSKPYGYVIRKLIADNQTHTKVSARLMGFGTSAALDIADRCLIKVWSLERCNSYHMNQDPPIHGHRLHDRIIVNVSAPRGTSYQFYFILLE
jgi:hypothetical protein